MEVLWGGDDFGLDISSLQSELFTHQEAPAILVSDDFLPSEVMDFDQNRLLGLIARTPRGRVVLPAGYAHMGMAPAGEDCAQQRLPVEP